MDWAQIMARPAKQRIEYRLIGREQQPLLIIDNAISEPQCLLDIALQSSGVHPAKGHYPGIRQPAPPDYGKGLQQQLAELLRQDFGFRCPPASQHGFFSMVLTPPSQLSLVQRLPHFDQPCPADLAMLHYLCDGCHGGTSFYRHRQSGFEFIDQQRISAYTTQLSQQIHDDGAPQGYINGDNQWFERIEQVEARYNRLIIYRCSSLHSGDINGDNELVADPVTGRFTLASFWQAQDSFPA